jgi:hypothetical protein
MSERTTARVVAIHQPNFFPWLGYFNKIARSDAFVFLDDVQFPKTGGVWCNRVQLLVADEPKWVSAAVERNYHGTRTIREMQFAASEWRQTAFRSIEGNYRKHPCYAEVMPVLQPLIENGETSVAAYNIRAIRTIAERLGLDVSHLHCSSEIEHAGASNERLCSLTLAVGGVTYMCGGGADSYQEEAVFTAHSVALMRQSFVHPTYPQRRRKEGFVPGLSIIDALMNVGWAATAALVRANGVPA